MLKGKIKKMSSTSQERSERDCRTENLATFTE